MIEVCRQLDKTGAPEQMYANCEVSEFNLSQATQLRCSDNQFTTCGECDACKLSAHMIVVRDNIQRFSDHTKRRFLLGLVRRLNSADLLENLTRQLNAILGKDFTYARSRPCPSLPTDQVTVGSDRALTSDHVEQFLKASWEWFGSCGYWSKLNYLLNVLRDCDIHLLSSVCNQASCLLATEKKNARLAESNITTDYSLSSSVSNSSYRSKDHPELALLVASNPTYSMINKDPFSGESLPDHCVGEIYEDNNSDAESLTSSVDPTCLVIPASSKAISGVARYCDFIQCLPVFLSKMVLSFLDKASLYNCLGVTRYWRSLVEQVHQDFYVNQQLWEDVMLLQGGAAQSVNPLYAKDIDVLVPNINAYTQETIKSDNAVIKTNFKSEQSFFTAYSGVSTRNIIMEERNVYCGAYNVLVLIEKEDPHRVFTTTGDNIIAIGGKDNRVRFVDTDTGRETGPVITGHSGSIRCIAISRERNIVLSGSYDTSIRMWNLQTGQCMKIMHGHRDTVVSVVIHGHIAASASKDATCKMWNLDTGKCMQTYRHRHPVVAINTDGEKCITGCEAGRVKVWDLKSGKIIKRLYAHRGAVTGIKFDRWHIVTSSRDGYAMAWSALGDHSRCLVALHHPKEVLTLEFMYLRAITGCADGRLRIWNIINGQCCRIMRGNSRSDPIQAIIAIGDRITLNTHANLLLLNFETVEWDYSLENDAVPPLVQYGKYCDAPVRPQSYPYVRAQRMKRAGSTNPQILRGRNTNQCHNEKSSRLNHSAKPISNPLLEKARLIQSGRRKPDILPPSPMKTSPQIQKVESWLTTSSRTDGSVCGGYGKINASELNLRTLKSAPVKKSLSSDTKKTKSLGRSVSIAENKLEIDDAANPYIVDKRRVSWAFEQPKHKKSHDISLSETKSLLRSQIRMKEEHILPPDFVYLAVNAIQMSLAHSETAKNTEKNILDVHSFRKKYNENIEERPMSGPMRIDPRNKIPTDELGWDKFLDDIQSEMVSEVSVKSSKKETPKQEVKHQVKHNEVYTTALTVSTSRKDVWKASTGESLGDSHLIRPHTALVTKKPFPDDSIEDKRPATAIGLKNVRPHCVRRALPGSAFAKNKVKPITSSAREVQMVPMMMYPPDMKDRLEKLKDRSRSHDDDSTLAIDSQQPPQPALGKVSRYNHPLRTHVKFTLRTFAEEDEIIENARKAKLAAVFEETKSKVSCT